MRRIERKEPAKRYFVILPLPRSGNTSSYFDNGNAGMAGRTGFEFGCIFVDHFQAIIEIATTMITPEA
jgi:hypothetical protein